MRATAILSVGQLRLHNQVDNWKKLLRNRPSRPTWTGPPPPQQLLCLYGSYVRVTYVLIVQLRSFHRL